MGGLKKGLTASGLLALIVFAMIINPLILMIAWNAVMPSTFGLAAIGFWKAFGLSIVARCLMPSGSK